jgi:PhnB protein
MQNLTPYLKFPGTCETALNFYAAAFGGRITELKRFSEAPQMPHPKKTDILHARFEAGGVRLMASDGDSKGAAKDTESARIGLSVEMTDAAEMDRVFGKLAEGGTVTMPIAEQFWGARFGMLTDAFGISWMFNCDAKK